MALRALLTALAAGLYLFASQSLALAQDKVDWLRGEGETLEMRLRGEIEDAAGKPAADAKLLVQYDDRNQIVEAPIQREGNRFESWIPVGKLEWFSVYLDCESPDGKGSALKRIAMQELRQAAIDGVTLTLKPFDRVVEVKVMHEGAAVPGAKFRARSALRRDIRATSDEKGIARIGMSKEDRFYQITAWTDDHRIGGNNFNSPKGGDPKADTHVIELSKCRPLKVRVANSDDGSPIAGLAITVQAATPAPEYNSVGVIPESTITTDAKGEAVMEWLPDWPEHHFYANQLDSTWIEDGAVSLDSNGVLQVSLKKKTVATRKRIEGEVTTTKGSPAGFCVGLRSFQGEVADRSDGMMVFTDTNGRFSARVLPGATYCAILQDTKMVAQMTPLVPYDPKTDKFTSYKLQAVEGTPVVLAVTKGLKREPIPGVSLWLRANISYSWIENGEARHGTGSRDTYGTTDEQGIWKTIAFPGEELEANVRETDWEMEKKSKAVAGVVNEIHFHRPRTEKQKIAGKVVLSPKATTSLAGAQISLTALDHVSKDRQTAKIGADGSFEMETDADSFGLFATTADGSAAGFMFVEGADPMPPYSLVLEPTGDYQGQLFDENGSPLSKVGLHYTLREFPVSEPLQARKGIQFYDLKESTTKTDREGHFTIKGAPLGAELQIYSDRMSDVGQAFVLRTKISPQTFLKPIETVVSTRLKARLDMAKRDARIDGRHVLVVMHPSSDVARDFVADTLYNYEVTKEVGDFHYVFQRVDGHYNTQDDRDYASSLKWPSASQNKVVAIAIDATGKESGQIELDLTDLSSIDKAVAFVKKSAPPQRDAKKLWEEAMQLAKSTDRRVLVYASEPFNVECQRVARWLEGNKHVLEKDYVVLRIDIARDLAGKETVNSFLADRKPDDALPGYAIFDAKGARLASNSGPAGWNEFPGEEAARRHLKEGLLATKQKLTSDEIDQLIKSLP